MLFRQAFDITSLIYNFEKDMSRGCIMNNDFPRIVTLLRKERGLSQKQAALELGVSQALLSHYEKGIRECGLDFVVKIADYYNVSCDYLLGRSLDRTGAQVRINEPVVRSAQEKTDEPSKPNAMITMNKKLITDSMNIIFEILNRTEHRGLTSEVSAFFMVSVYKMMRALYSSNPKNPQAMFSVIPELYQGVSTALMSIVESNIGCITAGRPTSEHSAVDSSATPQLSPDILSKKYPELAPSLYNLIRDTEEKMKKLT